MTLRSAASIGAIVPRCPDGHRRSRDGKTYAELDREDPLREVAMNSSFLQASLFTSVLAFGVAAMAVAVGLLFVLIGLGIRDVSHRVH